jgi:hypothetical protein
MIQAWLSLTGLVRLGLMMLGAKGGPRGPYWTWRRETAFGLHSGVSRAMMFKAARDYSRWISLMRRI